MSPWAVRIGVFIGNFSVGSEKHTLVWIQPQSMALFCQSLMAAPVNIAMEDFKPLHCQTHTERWAIPLLLCLLWGFLFNLRGPGLESQEWCWAWDTHMGHSRTSVCLPWNIIKGRWAAPLPSLQLEHPFDRTRHKPHFRKQVCEVLEVMIQGGSANVLCLKSITVFKMK